MKKALYDIYKGVSEAVLPPLAHSQFREKGVLTPQEFVQAGDYLVRTCPTWSWEAGDAARRRSYLPDDKQFLITRNVPCLQRASAVESYAAEMPSVDAGEEVEGGEWVATSSEADETFEELPATSAHGPVRDLDAEEKAQDEDAGSAEDEAVLDISNLDLDADDAVAPAICAATHASAAPQVLQTRTYDILISYDKHYQVPRVWLVGYSEDRSPLTQDDVLQDVISDYYTHRDRKTVSVEDHPHAAAGGKVVSIHPCRHADVMKKLAGVVAGEGGEFPVEHYMVLFPKFISSVVPTIEYDFTMPAGM